MSTQPSVSQLDFSQYADWLRWRAGRFTAGPPQLLSQYGIQLEDWRVKPVATLYGLAEITGIPTLIRWGQAIIQNRPIADVEREYYQRIAKELQQAGINVDEKTLRARVEQTTLHAALTALPLAVPFSRREAALLAKSLAAGFGAVGAPTAFIRTAQGYPDEALKAFVETGLAGTVITDAALILRNLAAGATPETLAAIRNKVAQRRGGAPWRDPETDAFINQINEALLDLKRGDTSKYDALLRQFEEWQRKIAEFQELYKLKHEGRLTPEQERRYYDLLSEIAKIKDRYELLKQYIEAAREAGLETRARYLEFQQRTIEDLARATQEAPPGPPPKDLMQWLQRIDLDLLQKLVKNQNLLSRYARRFGVDEQTLAERATLVLRERQWERLAEMPSGELKRILMDEQLLKKYATDFNIAEDRLRALIEELLQRRMGVKPPEPPPEKSPIEPIKSPEVQPKPPETQFRPPEVKTRDGQVLIVRPKEEELKPTVTRLDDLPAVQSRLRYLLRRWRDEGTGYRLRGDVDGQQGLREDVPDKTGEKTPTRTRDEAPGKTADEAPNKTADEAPGKTIDTTPTKTADREVLVLDRDALRILIPALPASIFAMPAPAVLAFISRTVGMPVALAPGLPKPSPRESFGAWLDRVFAGTGFTWRSLATQKETFVFA